MPQPRRAPSTAKPKLSHKSELQVIVAAAELGEAPSEFLERAAAKELAEARQTLRVRNLEAHEHEARRSNNPTPMPSDFGLPANYRMSRPSR